MQEGVFTTEVRLNDEEARTRVTVNKEQLILKTADAEAISTPILSSKRLIEVDEMNPKIVRFALETGKLPATCSSRKDRELLVLAVRYFQLLLYCTAPITATASLLLSYFSESASQFIAHFDIGLELGQTRRELFLALEANDQLQAEKQQLKRQIGQMEREMDDTLGAYRAMMEETNRGGQDEEWENEKLRANIAELKAENDKLNEVIRKLESRISLLQETNNSYKARLLDLQSHLEELLISRESTLPRSYQLEALEPIPNSPRCSKVMTSSSVKTARRTESHISLKLENEVARLKADHKAAVNQMKDRYEAKCAALRKIVEIQKQQLIDAKSTLEMTTKGASGEISMQEDSLKGQVDPVKTEIDPVKTEIDPVKAETDPLKAETDPLKAEIDPVKAGIDPLKAEIDPVKAGIDPMKAEIDPLKAEIEPLKAEIDSLKAAIDPLKAETEALKAALAEASKEKTVLETALKASKSETEKCQSEADALSAKLSRAEAQVRKAQRQMSVNTG